jgi:hypothetical protein
MMRLRSVSIKNRSSFTTVYYKLRCRSRIEAMLLRTRIRIDDFTIGLRQFFTGAISQHGANLALKHFKCLTSDYTFSMGFSS